MDHNLILRTVIFEQQLNIYKTSLFHERKIELQAELESIKPTSKNAYQRKALRTAISDCEKAIERSEKYNNEVTKEFVSHCPDKLKILEYIDSTTDLFIDFTKLVIQSINDASTSNPVTLQASILKKGTGQNEIMINGEIFTVNY